MKLRMGKTTTTVTIAADGALVIECFDFSDEAHDHLGSDVAFTATVAAEDKAKVLALLVAEAQVPPEEPLDDAAATAHRASIPELLPDQGVARGAPCRVQDGVRSVGLARLLGRKGGT